MHKNQRILMLMEFQTICGIMMPFVGTVLGALSVFFIKGLNMRVSAMLSGFAGGVMMAASFFSLILPAIEGAEKLGALSFLPATVGFLFGVIALLLLDKLVPHLHLDGRREGVRSKTSSVGMLVFAVTMHNFPEGVAVGVLYAAVLANEVGASLAAAAVFALGVAVQNFPEGAIISLPLAAEGVKKSRAFALGVLSAAVELLGALFALLLSSLALPLLPYLLGFAAGAMVYVVVEELIPEIALDKKSNVGTVAFAVGFTVMMVLDVALG